MAGGIGSRFWPLSTPEFPKQFIDILGCGRSLIQLTVDRFKGICPPENFWVVTNQAYVDIVKEQIPGIPSAHILAEPAARNTAPCIAWACWSIRQEDPDANVVVTPSDAVVMNPEEFRRVISGALEFTSAHDFIVTIGIKPNRPETGYGYVKTVQKGTVPNCTVLEIFPQCEKISIDYAVMEPASADKKVYTHPADFGWSDLGNWQSLHEKLTKDAQNNASVGNVYFYESSNCVVHAEGLKKVVLQGLDGYIVSEKNGQLLVCRRSEEQRIKEFGAK